MDMELMAPGGDMNSLIAAVENGADAVYLGGKSFGARKYAGNFDREEMKKAVEYCHLRGVKVYVTVNILTKDSELKGIPEYAAYLYSTGVDALIIQDLGVGKLIKDLIPDFPLYASTQMTAHNLESVNFLYDLGYKRAVLSRELSMKEIEYIASNTKAEVEVFAHGALCICYSGQCLMSSMIGGRSGNRGGCAQPCRQKYVLDREGCTGTEGYLLSPKDFSTIENIGSLMESGVVSLKLEGRMKKPEYVAAVTSIYRKAIDNYKMFGNTDIPEKDKKTLLQVFNRGGFTTAHLFGKGGREMMSFERPKNWGLYIGRITNVFPKEDKAEIQLEEDLSPGDGIEIWTQKGDNIGYVIENMTIKGKPSAKGTPGNKVLINYKGGRKGDKVYKTADVEINKYLESTYSSSDPLRKIPLMCAVTVNKDRPVEVVLKDKEGSSIRVEGPIPEKALKVSLDETRLKEQISKFGGTPFRLESLDINLQDGLSVPVSAINRMRREAVDKLSEMRLEKSRPAAIDSIAVEDKGSSILSKREEKAKGDARISVKLSDSSLVDSAIGGGADIIIFGGDRLRGYDYDFAKAIKKCREKNVPLYISSPRIIRNEYKKILDDLNKAMDEGAEGIYADNLGILNYSIEKAIPFSSGFSLNTFNLIAAGLLESMGSRFLSISPELSLSEIRNLAPYIEYCEALCYGRIEMMVSEYCPVGAASQEKCMEGNGVPPCQGRDASLKDRMGMVFPVKTDLYCRSHIYNSKVLSMLEDLKGIVDSGVNILRLNMLDEDKDEVFKIVKSFKEAAVSIKDNLPLPESVKDTSEYIKKIGYTKGHYYRGVE